MIRTSFLAIALLAGLLHQAQAAQDTCPDSVATSDGNTLNLRGLINAQGSPSAALQALRQSLSQIRAGGSCSSFANAAECNATLDLTQRGIAALEACLNATSPRNQPTKSAAARQPETLKPPAPDNPWAEKPFEPLDPAGNYEGSSCKFFTKPFIRAGGGGTNSYAIGAHVCYGTRFYRCDATGSTVGGVDVGKWKGVGPCAAFKDGTSSKFKAEVLEGGR